MSHLASEERGLQNRLSVGPVTFHGETATGISGSICVDDGNFPEGVFIARGLWGRLDLFELIGSKANISGPVEFFTSPPHNRGRGNLTVELAAEIEGGLKVDWRTTGDQRSNNRLAVVGKFYQSIELSFEGNRSDCPIFFALVGVSKLPDGWFQERLGFMPGSVNFVEISPDVHLYALSMKPEDQGILAVRNYDGQGPTEISFGKNRTINIIRSGGLLRCAVHFPPPPSGRSSSTKH